MRFSEVEVRELSKAWVAISFAFAIALSGGIGSNFGLVFVIAGLTVGIAFIFHELAHKLVAQRMGCWAEFRSFDMGLILAVVMSFFGFVFAAPGAVMISGLVTTEENGKIAALGPIVNIGLAVIFYLASILVPANLISMPIRIFLSYGYSINAWLAFFNLIPFGPLDGVKVLRWSQPIWFTLIAIAGMMTFFVG